jgi:hypothetical protein
LFASQQISTAEPERIGFIELETSADESFGIVGEKMVSIVAIMATFLEPEKVGPVVSSCD